MIPIDCLSQYNDSYRRRLKAGEHFFETLFTFLKRWRRTLVPCSLQRIAIAKHRCSAALTGVVPLMPPGFSLAHFLCVIVVTAPATDRLH